MYTSQQLTDFTKRVGLGNCYCNCFHWMCRIEKIPGTFLKKSSYSRDIPCCTAPVRTWKYSAAHFLSFSTRLHKFFSCVGVLWLCTQFGFANCHDLWQQEPNLNHKYIPAPAFGCTCMSHNRFDAIFWCQKYSKQPDVCSNSMASKTHGWIGLVWVEVEVPVNLR